MISWYYPPMELTSGRKVVIGAFFIARTVFAGNYIRFMGGTVKSRAQWMKNTSRSDNHHTSNYGAF